jgi:serine/threonine protein kinase
MTANHIAMQSPLPLGTVLQNRYRLLKILGQGGFGRTYLAEDQGRFNERCALKEFVGISTGTYTVEKSKELFGREAAVLYQIQHPQIPQFRATIEQDGRLFLVQDYVEGKTYRACQLERQQTGKNFSETEVLHLLQQMLPVLDYIHSKGIVHRDISPDNIILRDRDRLPVLIDFGVVKELVTRFQSPQASIPATTVGKIGYAPPEQIQTGRAYPNSDLYALAVTCIVLLTGQDPQDLFDETSLSWTWYRWIQPIDPGLTAVLNQMLSNKPSDRYQNARDAAAALKSLYRNPQAFPKTLPSQPQATNSTQYSQMQTQAVGNMGASGGSQYAGSQSKPVIPTPVARSSWDNPLLVTFVGLFLAAIAGFGSWALVSALLNRQQTDIPTVAIPSIPVPTVFNSPTETPTPTPTATLTETPTPTPLPTPTTSNQRLNLLPGDTQAAPGTLRANDTVNYIVSGTAGQKLSVSLDEEGVLMSILSLSEIPLDEKARRVSRWEGVLPADGDYIIQLRTVKGVAESAYKLEVRLANPEPTPSPTVSPDVSDKPTPNASPSLTPEFSVAPPVTNEYDEVPLDLPPGNASAQISGTTSVRRVKRYLVYAQAGQVLSARLQTGKATLDIRYPDGRLVENASGLGEWEGKVEGSGEYQIDVKSNEATNFTLDVSVRQ